MSVSQPDQASGFDIGDEVVLTANFTNPADNTPVDPDTVTFTLRDPNGRNISPTATRLSLGSYQASYVLQPTDKWGWWGCAVDATGGHWGSEEGQFFVKHRTVPR